MGAWGKWHGPFRLNVERNQLKTSSWLQQYFHNEIGTKMLSTNFSQALGKLSPERGGGKAKKKNTETTENTGKTCVLKLCTAKKKEKSCLHPTARQSRPPATAAASYASLRPKTELITFFGSCCSSSSSFSPPGPICNLNNMAAPAKYPNPGDKSTGKEKRRRRRRSAVDFILAP